MSAGEGLFDIDRMSDWFEAERRANLGDIEPLAKFIEEWGASYEWERQFVAATLIRKPDPRDATKPQTERMLHDLDVLLLKRAFINDHVVPDLNRRVERAHRWLQRLGTPESEIKRKLKARKLVKHKPLSLDLLYCSVADLHGLTPGAVKRAHIRSKKASDDPP